MIATIINSLHSLFTAHPELAIFLSLAAGFYIGKLRFGTFQLGGVAGSLLAAVIVSQVGVNIHPTVQAILFALFIYAVGFESGPQFFKSLGLKTMKEIIMAVTLAATGLLTVVVLARAFGLDKGLAAGIAAGGLTQSAIIGTASDAINALGFTAEEAGRLKANVATGYAVTYIFGSFGAILICANFLPFVLRRGIREDALKAEIEGHNSTADENSALTPLVGRIYKLKPLSAFTVAELEAKVGESGVTIEKVRRHRKMLPVAPELELRGGDVVLVVGRREKVLSLVPELGPELRNEPGMELRMSTCEVALTNNKYTGTSLREILARGDHGRLAHGVSLQSVTRNGSAMPVTMDTVLEKGDLLRFYGTEQDVRRVSSLLGYTVVHGIKTDFVYLGLGLFVGLMIGLIVVRVGDLPLTLGSGGGALLSGLMFGWLRGKRPTFGALPQGAVLFLKDIGLAGFVVCVGLVNGHQAIQTVKEQGLTIFMIGLVVTVLPLVITMFFGRYILRYDNVAVLAGALSGSRSANPAFGQVLDIAGNSVPTVPFAVTYALANVFLSLLGPLIVAIV